MRQAVILAAGAGTRLRSVLDNRPKGFLELGEQTLIERSVSCLLEAGIENIIIVTGYCSDFYESLAAEHNSHIRTVHNPKYAESGSMYSLYCARASIVPPFLLLESDLIYEKRALYTLIEDQSESAILLSGPTGAGDEVYVSTERNMLVSMSKDRLALENPPTGELVGITKISANLFGKMIEISSNMFRHSLRIDYETDCLVAAGREVPIHCPLVDDLLWTEVDDEKHFGIARDLVHPAILAKEV